MNKNIKYALAFIASVILGMLEPIIRIIQSGATPTHAQIIQAIATGIGGTALFHATSPKTQAVEAETTALVSGMSLPVSVGTMSVPVIPTEPK